MNPRDESPIAGFDPPKPRRGLELQALVHAERKGIPFIAYRDGDDAYCIAQIPPASDAFTIGRAPGCVLQLSWDPQVSRVHAEIERVGTELFVADDGLSRNGTFVAGQRISGRRRLSDGEYLRIGESILLFRDPAASGATQETDLSRKPLDAVLLTPAQSDVANLILEMTVTDSEVAILPSNREIAERLSITTDVVKTHLRAIFAKYGLADVPQNRKRAMLVEMLRVRGFTVRGG